MRQTLQLMRGEGLLVLIGLVALPLWAEPPRWELAREHRHAALVVAEKGRAGFTLLPSSQTGIAFTNIISEELVAERHNMVSGSGVALGDYDGDGLCDIYLCNRGGENALFRNLGSWNFQNVTAEAGVACSGQSSTGATFADINGDGRLDLIVNSFLGPGACFLNLGNGRFTNVTEAVGLISRGGATSLALADLDGDGDLDLYIAYFGIESVVREGGRIATKTVGGQPVVTGRYARRVRIVDGQLVELGEEDMLYFNDGRGHFTAADWARHFVGEDGRPLPKAPLDFGLAVQIRDINQDGHPDIYVCNDFQTPDHVWINDGTGHFRPLPPLALRNMSYASMGVDFADVDRDGRLDFITVEMLSRQHAQRLRQSSSMPKITRQIGVFDDQESVPRNTLYWNRGDGTYAEIAWFSHLAASDWSWTPIFLDADLDGYEDLFVSTGNLYDVNDRDALERTPRMGAPARTKEQRRRLLAHYPRLEDRKAAFRNRGDLTFQDMSQAWRFDSPQVCHGMAVADLDLDGDLDIVANCANAAPLVYRNDASAPRLAVRLKGLPPNTRGIGSKITLIGGAVPVQTQEMICGGRYMSGDDSIRVFAAGAFTNEMKLEIAWRTGRKTVIQHVKPNSIYEVVESATNALAPGGSKQ